MSETYKILGQVLTNTLDNVYTLYSTPNTTQTVISSIQIINTHSSSILYRLGVVLSADSGTPGIAPIQGIVPFITINPGEVDEIVGGIMLSSMDQIRIETISPFLVIHAYGVELS